MDATRASCRSATQRALADAIVDLMDRPDERARLAAAARVTAQRYDITAFVRKMEQLYVLLCDGSRARKAGGRREPLGPICPFSHEMTSPSSRRRRCSSKAGIW